MKFLPDVEKIVESYLKCHNADGLYNADDDCGCWIGRLAPCRAVFLDCVPAVIINKDCRGRVFEPIRIGVEK